MKYIALISIIGLAFTPVAGARRKGAQDRAFEAHQSGQIMALHDIESRIVPKMPGCDYLGPEFDAYSGIYRLKFMRGGTVIYVYVDGRTGQIIGRSGS